MSDAITSTNVWAGVWALKGRGDPTPWYLLPEREDRKRPGVIYADGLEAAFRGLASATWKAGSVADLAA